jgi:hypothetical protein
MSKCASFERATQYAMLRNRGIDHQWALEYSRDYSPLDD